MQCPECSHGDSRVVDSRPADGGMSIRRRRECERCDARFTTYERVANVRMVRKRSGLLQPFSAEKVRIGLASALADRPLPTGGVEGIVERIDAQLQEFGSPVDSERIGQLVLAELRALDEVAYLRFASVYQDFQGARDFEEALASLEDPVALND
ncbi:MAG: transcriptional regulator NrdR [Acidimicrobiia bacterium]